MNVNKLNFCYFSNNNIFQNGYKSIFNKKELKTKKDRFLIKRT